MPTLEILEYPDPRLRTTAEPVIRVDARVQRLVDDLFETMYAAPGVGLAASQVNVHKRVIVIDISENQDQPHVFINPELTLSGPQIETDEGCLSVPGFYEPVTRAEKVIVKALDQSGAAFELETDGMLGVCIQHECDHLVGKLFVDYISSLKRTRIRKKLEKLRRLRA